MSSATPGPIPIVRAGDNGQVSASEGTPLARQGSSGSYLGLSTSLGGGSFKEAMALSFGKDVAEYVNDCLELTIQLPRVLTRTLLVVDRLGCDDDCNTLICPP